MARIAESVFARLVELKTRAATRHTLIDLGIGSPDRRMTQPVRDALARAVVESDDHGYPPWRGTPTYLAAAAAFLERRFGVALDPSRELLCTSGAEEAFAHIALACLDSGATCLIGDIHYPTHRRSASLAGANVEFMPLRREDGYLPRLDEVPADVAERTRMLVINYPHNPTGAIADMDFLSRAVDFCRTHDILLVSDLAYSEMCFDGPPAPSVLQVPGARDVAIELHSFSKSFSMAGLRLAFVAGNASALDRLYALRTMCTYGSPAVLQRAGASVLDMAHEVAPAVRDVYRERRDALAIGLTQMGWRGTPPPAGMFFWLPLPAGFTSDSFTEFLIESAGVVVTPGHAFGPGGEGWFRIALVAEVPVLESAVRRMQAAGVSWTNGGQ